MTGKSCAGQEHQPPQDVSACLRPPHLQRIESRCYKTSHTPQMNVTPPATLMQSAQTSSCTTGNLTMPVSVVESTASSTDQVAPSTQPSNGRHATRPPATSSPQLRRSSAKAVSTDQPLMPTETREQPAQQLVQPISLQLPLTSTMFKAQFAKPTLNANTCDGNSSKRMPKHAPSQSS